MLSSIRNVNREKINRLPTWSNIVIFDSGIFLGSKIRITLLGKNPTLSLPFGAAPYGSTPGEKPL